MELSPELQQLLDTKSVGDNFSIAESVLMSTEIIKLLTMAGVEVRTAVELVHRYRDANWGAGYDAGYKSGVAE